MSIVRCTLLIETWCVMVKRKRETDEERAARDREERIALLKMKQGIIEESEMIPETGYAPPPEENLLARISSFVYRNKIFVVLGVLFAVISIVLIVQLITREKDDLRVLLVAFDPNSKMYLYTDRLEEALEMYCPDFDGNGKVCVTVTYIDRTSREDSSQYDDTQAQKLNLEFEVGEVQLVITDEQILEWVNYDGKDNAEAIRDFFVEQTDKRSEDELYYGCGIRANSTELPADAGWSGCPDNVFFFILNGSRSDSPEKSDKSRERAQIVLRNILDNNIVNPKTD